MKIFHISPLLPELWGKLKYSLYTEIRSTTTPIPVGEWFLLLEAWISNFYIKNVYIPKYLYLIIGKKFR